jgi:hypothetical protein
LDTSPAVRASAVRDTLDFLNEFEPGARERVMARVPPASREIIESTPRSSWIGLEHDHYTIDAMIQIFGRERAIQCWCDALGALVDRPLLKSFVQGMVSVFGRDPARVVGLFPRGWPLVYRGCCTPVMLQGADGAPVIRFEGISPVVRKYANYLDSWHGACLGFAHIARVDGHVEFTVAPDVSYAEARFSWG